MKLTELGMFPTDDGSFFRHGLRPRRCELCGKVFHPNARGQRFCSEACRSSKCRTCRFLVGEGKRGAFCMVYGEKLVEGGLIKRCSAYVERPDNRQQPR